MDGFPIHEVVGEVIASRHRSHGVGDRVVGWASGFDGLMEYVVADGDGLAPYDPALSPQHAVALQPLACVLYALEQLPEPQGSPRRRHRPGLDRAAVLLCGKGFRVRATSPASIPIDRDGVGKEFGVDTVVRATSDRWVSHLDADDRPDIVIEAVGHQVATLGHAIEAAAFGGTVFYFGVPDDDSYPISMRTMLRNNLTLKSGVTLDRRRVLRAANEFAREHPELLAAYVTHTFGVDDVQAAFELACRPTPERIKIAIVAMTLKQAAGSAGRQGAGLGRMGGRARRSSAPRNSPAPGTTTSDSTSSTAISTTPTSPCCCAGWSTCPIATAVRLPSADPAPDRPRARRRRRRGHHRDGRVGRTGGRRGRRHPLCARRGAQLRAAAGQPRPRPRRARGAGERVRDDRDGAGAGGARRDLRRARAGRRLRRPGGPGDLAGLRAGRRVDARRRCSTRWRASRPPRRRPAWSPASTPAQASPERPWPSWAFG